MNAPVLRRALAVPVVAAFLAVGCSSADWPAFRHDALRTAAQNEASPLSNPKMKALRFGWRFPAGRETLGGGFRASPVVYKGRVFIGNGNGYFYALSAKTGKRLWRYPKTGSPLQSEFVCNVSSLGIAASATIARVRGKDAVIFGAPDRSSYPGFGNGHLFALDTRTGEMLWKSPPIARLTGCRKQCKDELHENLGHSSPLVLGDKVYVGISDHCDDPVQKGRLVAVKLSNGEPIGTFRYCSTHLSGTPADLCDEKDTTRGGGVLSPPSGWKDGLYITTGNTSSGQVFKPGTNHGLSLLRLDSVTGAVVWKFQPVPWELDADSDWSAAPTVMKTSCGPMIVSTQKDGWTHAVNAAMGSRLWSFPPQKCLPFQCGEGVHGDSRYMRSGAAWGDVYVTMNGGLDMTPRDVTAGYRRLHAFNVCEPNPAKRLRWLIDFKDYTSKDCACLPVEACSQLCISNPTISRGIVYLGTDLGYLLAIADPAVASDDGLRCMNADVASEDCERMGYGLVRQPRILAKVLLDGPIIYNEPVLAYGKVFVSTDVDRITSKGGYVYMLRPRD